jgi:hypothetical protein
LNPWRSASRDENSGSESSENRMLGGIAPVTTEGVMTEKWCFLDNNRVVSTLVVFDASCNLLIFSDIGVDSQGTSNCLGIRMPVRTGASMLSHSG